MGPPTSTSLSSPTTPSGLPARYPAASEVQVQVVKAQPTLFHVHEEPAGLRHLALLLQDGVQGLQGPRLVLPTISDKSFLFVDKIDVFALSFYIFLLFECFD